MAIKESILVLLNLLAAYRYQTLNPPDWDYRDVGRWLIDYPMCGGVNQSPINLESTTAIGFLEPPLKFKNYNAPFLRKPTIENNAHSAEITLSETVHGTRPIISGGLLKGEYEAHSIHFHWGSIFSKGSEHVINGRRYDAELHIVHKNMKYGNAHEASRHRDGMVVLSILIKISDSPFTTYPGLNTVFNKLSEIRKPFTNTTLSRDLSLNNFLGNINTRDFFSYKGSVTTPPCAESVTWVVFAQPLLIPRAQIQKLYKLRVESGLPLINNFRPLQAVNGRYIFRQKG